MKLQHEILMTKRILPILIALLLAQSALANDIIRLSEHHDFIRIHETQSDDSDFIRKSNIESIVIRKRDNDWHVLITTSEIGSFDRGDPNSSRIYSYKLLTQSKAEDFATQLIEASTEKEEED